MRRREHQLRSVRKDNKASYHNCAADNDKLIDNEPYGNDRFDPRSAPSSAGQPDNESDGYEKEATTVYGNYTSRAVPMFNLPPVLVYPISCSIVPLISAARGQGDTKRVGTIMESSLRTAVLIGAPCALGMTVLARPILSLFFTGAEAIDNAAPLLRLLAPSTFFVCILAVLTAMLQSCGKERLPLVSMCIGAVVKIIGSFVFIRLIGIYGAPVSTFFCYITICSIHLFFVRKHTGLTIKTGTVFVRPIFCAVLCAAAAYGAYFVSSSVLSARLATVVSIAAAIIVYVAAIFLFGAVRRGRYNASSQGRQALRHSQKNETPQKIKVME